MITKFSIENFKSLNIPRNRPVEFSPGLNIIIGLNSSGKSTLLQAVDFVCSLSRPQGVSQWLGKHEWVQDDIVNNLRGGGSSIIVQFSIELGQPEPSFVWTGRYNTKSGVCTEESVENLLNGERIFYSARNKALRLKSKEESTLFPDIGYLRYSGSLFSVFDSEWLRSFRESLSRCYSLDLLSPNLMRLRTKKKDVQGVGVGGEQLGNVLYGLDKEERQKLEQIMRRFVPTFSTTASRRQQGGSIRYAVVEKFGESVSCQTDASHVSDGILRVLALVVSAMKCKGGTLLIDELEDGLNPELLEKLMLYFQSEANCQVIITTHSPIILSFLNDHDAREAVKLMYKDAAGMSHCVPFFDLHTPSEMLRTLYPGEVMLQCNLEDITQEAAQYESI